jgi:hypothetical protein
MLAWSLKVDLYIMILVSTNALAREESSIRTQILGMVEGFHHAFFAFCQMVRCLTILCLYRFADGFVPLVDSFLIWIIFLIGLLPSISK